MAHTIQIFGSGKTPENPGFFPAVVFVLQNRLLMRVILYVVAGSNDRENALIETTGRRSIRRLHYKLQKRRCNLRLA